MGKGSEKRVAAETVWWFLLEKIWECLDKSVINNRRWFLGGWKNTGDSMQLTLVVPWGSPDLIVGCSLGAPQLHLHDQLSLGTARPEQHHMFDPLALNTSLVTENYLLDPGHPQHCLGWSPNPCKNKQTNKHEIKHTIKYNPHQSS